MYDLFVDNCHCIKEVISSITVLQCAIENEAEEITQEDICNNLELILDKLKLVKGNFSTILDNFPKELSKEEIL